MKKIYLLLFTIIISLTVSAQTPYILWQKSLGGSGGDSAYSIIQTTDGGYAVAGYSNSVDSDVTGNHGYSDYWVVKLNSTGTIQWQKALGGSGADQAYSIIQTTDGGYVIAGMSNSTNGDVTGNHGGGDYWIVKLDSTGTIQWQKSLGGSGIDQAYSIIQTIDGGYIVAGTSTSTDGDVTGNHGASDYWIVKLSSTGAIQWQKTLGGSGGEVASSIVQTSDSGYVIAGTSTSNNNGDVTGHHGGFDYWIVKLSSTGIIQWQKSLGGSLNDWAFSVVQGIDSGYVVAGYSNSTNGDVTGNHGNNDAWVVKLSGTGTIQWQKSLGVSSADEACSIIQTTDSGYALTGSNGDLFIGWGHYWIVKLDGTGTLQWESYYGGSGTDVAYSIIQTNDGAYALAGYSNSTNGDITGNHGFYDYWIVKLGVCYNPSPSILPLAITICKGASVALTASGGGSYAWSNGLGTNPLVTVSPTTTTTYQVTVTGVGPCHASSDAVITVKQPAYQSLCMVTVDSNSSHNVVVWEKTNQEAVDSFYIYREISTNNYAKIGAIHRDSLSEYHDYGANPNITGYRYKISVKDTCGNEGTQSAYHNSIHLQYLGGGNLQWNVYAIENATTPVSTFDVYRDSSGSGNWQLMISVPGNQTTTTDINYNQNPTIKYRVVANWSFSCTPTRSIASVLSNIITVTPSDILETNYSNISIYPNPATNQLFIETNGMQVSEINIFNTTGSLVSSVRAIHESPQRIDISQLAQGVYIAEVKTKEVSVKRRWVKM